MHQAETSYYYIQDIFIFHFRLFILYPPLQKFNKLFLILIKKMYMTTFHGPFFLTFGEEVIFHTITVDMQFRTIPP